MLNLFKKMLKADDPAQELLYFVNSEVPARLAIFLKIAFLASDKKPIVIPQEDMAAQIGASRAFVSSLINEWKRKDIVRSVGRELHLVNYNKLVALSFDTDAAETLTRFNKRNIKPGHA